MNFSEENIVPDWLRRRSTANHEAVAIEHENSILTYAQLYERAVHLARVLKEQGAEADQPIGIIIRSGYWFALAVHALIAAGLTAMPINWRLTEEEVAWQCNDANVSFLIFDSKMEQYTANVLSCTVRPGIEKLGIEELMNVNCSSDCFIRTHISLKETQAIIYTSGTTGKPKGTLITFANHWWSATSSALQLGLSRTERWLVPMPLFHVGGLGVLMRSLIYGTTAVIQDSFDENAVLHALKYKSITLLSVVPTMLQRMISASAGEWDAPSLRCVLLGGSAIPKPLLEACEKLNIPVASSYGMTETNSQAATLPPEDSLRKFGSAGRPLFPTEIAIYKEGQFQEPFVEGEILVRGPTVTPGYLNRPDATAETIVDGWLHTGDIGYLDDEGYLFMLDRRSDLIVSGGENIYPAEVESVLLAHEAIREAGVVGVSDAVWGQIPIAFIVSESGETVPNLETYLRSRIAGYKIPKQFIVVEQLPRNASGKLLRRKLKEWLIK